MTNKKMAHGMAGATMITTHGGETPTNAEWDAYLKDEDQALRAKRISGILVYTNGGGPSSTQRAAYTQLLERHNATIPCAVVTDSVIVRGIVTALAWHLGTKHICAFPTKDLVHALGFAGVVHYDDVLSKLEALGRDVGVLIPRAKHHAA